MERGVSYIPVKDLVILDTLIKLSTKQQLSFPSTPREQRQLFKTLGKIHQRMMDLISPSKSPTTAEEL